MTKDLSQTFPSTRLRRLRRAAWSRALVSETRLSPADFIWAIVIREGDNMREAVASMPGVERFSVDQAVGAAREAKSLGIPALALFPFTSA
ncbi:MAG: porphobilinogen synthase, partial [Parvularculaceae bacterium]|nr:porphobilinogen synthase [Parvularculaceae bacterium]